MAKKFKNNFQDIFTPTTKAHEPTEKEENTSNEAMRTTLLMDKKNYEQIKAIAFYERKQIKDVINEAFLLKIKSYSDDELKSIMDVYQSK